MMDIGSLRFAPSALAAACLYHFSSEDLALECSGFKLPEISPAIRFVQTHFSRSMIDRLPVKIDNLTIEIIFF